MTDPTPMPTPMPTPGGPPPGGPPRRSLPPLLADALWLIAGIAVVFGFVYTVLRYGPVAWHAIWGA